jgi:allantoicase
MDSWETVRHNPKPFDSLELELASKSEINYISISTKYHLGNQVKSIRLLAFDANLAQWSEFLPTFSLKGHALVQIKLPNRVSAQKIKVEIYPDGGLSRLGLYHELPENMKDGFVPLNTAVPVIFEETIPTTDKPLQLEYLASPSKRAENLACIETEERFNTASAFYGAELISASDEHYAPASLLISPYLPLSMFDGFESARSHNSEHQEVVEIKLACKTNISDLEFDFTYFVNNNPDFLSVEACSNLDSDEWFEVIPRNPVKGFRAKQKSYELEKTVIASKVRLRIYPDGGVNRFKVFGTKA